MQLKNRNTAFHRSKIVRLTHDAIEQVRCGRVVTSIPFSQVCSVNLAFMGASPAGSNASPTYRCRVKDKQGRSIEFRNAGCVRFGEVAVSNELFRDMVSQLHQRLLTYRSGIQFRQGSNAFYWLGWLGLLMSALLVLMVPCLLFIEGGLGVVLRKSWTLALVPVFAGTCFLPLVQRGRSQAYAPDDLPLGHLPPCPSLAT